MAESTALAASFKDPGGAVTRAERIRVEEFFG